MTKAVFADAAGGPEIFDLREVDLPPPGAGEARVRHNAVGLNFIDIYQRKGLYPVSFPAILGSEAAGFGFNTPQFGKRRIVSGLGVLGKHGRSPFGYHLMVWI